MCASGQEALSASLLSLLDPGDEVVLFEPFYPFLLGAIQLAGAVPRAVRLRAPEFAITEADVEAVISSRTRLIVHNSSLPSHLCPPPPLHSSSERKYRAPVACVEGNI